MIEEVTKTSKNSINEDWGKIDQNRLKMYVLMEEIKLSAQLREVEHQIDFELKKTKKNSGANDDTKFTFYSIVGIYFMMYLCIGILPPNIPNLLKALPLSSSAGFGLLVATNLLVGMVVMLVLGYFGDRMYSKISRKSMFFLTNFIWVSCYGLIAVVPNFLVMLCFVAIGAIGVGAFLPIGFSMISDLFSPETRGTKFGMMHFVLVLGNGCGMLLGSLFGPLNLGTGWRLVYFFAGLFALITLLGFWLYGKNPSDIDAEPSLYRYSFNTKEVKLILKQKSLLGILGAVLGSWVAMATLATWSIFFLSQSFWNTPTATIIYIIAGLGALPGAIIGGKLGDIKYRNGAPRGRVLISCVGTIVGISCFFIFYSFPIMIFCGFLGYFFTAFAIGNQFALYTELVPIHFRNTVNALNGIMMNLGGIIGNLLISSLIRINTSILQGALFLILWIWVISTLCWKLPLDYYLYERVIPSSHKVLVIPSHALN